MASRTPWAASSPRYRTALPPAHVGWWVVALLAGLLAMHGLGTHGTHSAEAAPPPSAGHDLQTRPAHHAPPSATHDGSADSSVALGLCLALLGAGALWLGITRTRRHARWSVPRRSPAARSPLPATARDLSPPTRAQLSVWRC